MAFKDYIKNKASFLIEGAFGIFFLRVVFFLFKIFRKSLKMKKFSLAGVVFLAMLVLASVGYYSIQKIKLFFDESIPLKKRKKAFYKVFGLFFLLFFSFFLFFVFGSYFLI